MVNNKPEYDYDLFVIGAGSGGVRAARISAQYGAKVAIAEERYLGGTCVNVGCVPKKLFVYASEFSHAFKDAAGFGWTLTAPTFDWATLRDNKSREIERLNGIYGTLLNNAGVELFDGTATILGPHSVQVNGNTYSARNILVAVGGWPWVPDIEGKELAISSNDVFYLEQFPKRVIIVGGGYIAVEFAGIFHGLGCESHVVYRGPLFLKHFDEDIRQGLATQMKDQGIQLHFDNDITRITNNTDGSLAVNLKNGEILEVDAVMYATGREPKTAALGLEKTAVKLSASGAIEVNAQFQTAEPSIYALGDVIDRVALTPVAISEAMILAANLFKGGQGSMDYSNIATAVFSQPPIGTVGLTEAEAKTQLGEKLRVYRSEFRPLKQTLAGGTDKIVMKLLVDDDTDKVVGCHMLGEYAAEIIQGFAVAMKAGATKQHFDDTVGIHPSAAEEFVTMREPV